MMINCDYLGYTHTLYEGWGHMVKRRESRELNDDRVSRFRGFHELSDINSDEGQSWS